LASLIESARAPEPRGVTESPAPPESPAPSEASRLFEAPIDFEAPVPAPVSLDDWTLDRPAPVVDEGSPVVAQLPDRRRWAWRGAGGRGFRSRRLGWGRAAAAAIALLVVSGFAMQLRQGRQQALDRQAELEQHLSASRADLGALVTLARNHSNA